MTGGRFAEFSPGSPWRGIRTPIGVKILDIGFVPGG